MAGFVGGVSSTGDLGFGVVYHLKNMASMEAKRIQRDMTNLERVTTQATTNITRATSRMQLGFRGLALGVGITAPLIAASVYSAKLEDKMADVRKSTNLSAIEAERMQKALFNMNTRTGIMDLMEIMRIGGQAGTAKDQLLGFTSAIDKLNVALGEDFGGANEVSNAVAKLRNVLIDIKTERVDEDILRIGNAMNYLSMQGFNTAPGVAEFGRRIGSVGIPLGLTTAQVFGLSAALEEAGETAEVGGTAIPKILGLMARKTKEFAQIAGVSISEFEHQVNTDLFGAFQTFIRGLDKAENTVALSNMLEDVGLNSERAKGALFKLKANLDILNERTRQAGMALQNTNSIMDEFRVKNETNAAKIDKFKKAFQEAVNAVGQGNFTFGVLLKIGTKLLNVISGLAETKLGKVLIGLVSVTGLLVTAVSLLVIGINAARYAAGKASLAFAGMGKTEIATAFATQGLAAGMRSLAVATWTALAPLLPFIAAAAALTAALYGVHKMQNSTNERTKTFGYLLGPLFGQIGVIITLYNIWNNSQKEFQKYMDGSAKKASGMTGLLQRIGGAIKGVAAVWKSAGADGFSMSVQLRDALKEIGVHDFVVAIGTWAVRIKAFFKGIWDGFKPTRDAFNEFTSELGNVFDTAIGLLDKLGIHIGKNTSDVNKWSAAGKFLGFIFTTFIIPPIKLATYLMKGLVATAKGVVTVLRYTGRIIKALFSLDTYKTMFTAALTAGQMIVDNLKDGIKEKWSGFKVWLRGAINEIRSTLTFGLVGGSTGESSAAPGQSENKNNSPDFFDQILSAFQAKQTVTMRPVPASPQATTINETMHFPIYMDGRKIGEHIQKRERKIGRHKYNS